MAQAFTLTCSGSGAKNKGIVLRKVKIWLKILSFSCVSRVTQVPPPQDVDTLRPRALLQMATKGH